MAIEVSPTDFVGDGVYNVPKMQERTLFVKKIKKLPYGSFLSTDMIL